MKNLYRLLAAMAVTFLPMLVIGQPWMKQSIVSTTDKTTIQPDQEEWNFYDIQKKFNEYWKDKTPSENEDENQEEGGYQQFRRWEAFMKPRVYPSGSFDPEVLVREQQKQKMSNARQVAAHPTLTSANWTYVGPTSIPQNGGGTGRVNVIRFDPSNTNTVYIGAASGGVWKTTNGGSTWTSHTDFLDALSVADIAINPRYPDSIYVATGDGYGYENGSFDFWGGTYSAGVMISPDGGVTWNQSGLTYVQTQSSIIQRLLINPSDPDILLACTRSAILRSIDAGANWTSVQSGHFFDMEFKPGDPNTVYAGASSGLMISTNKGLTWTAAGTFSGGDRISLAVTDVNPLVIYALGANGNFYKSSNGGTSFQLKNSPSSLANFYGYYDAVLACSPMNENKVYVAGMNVVKTFDGGTTWTATGSNIHVDNHSLEFMPGNNNVIWCGNDGSVYSSTNSGTSWTDLGNGIGIKQYYRMGGSTLTPYTILAGAQDNGSDRLASGIWRKVAGADGMECLIDRTNDQVMFVSWQYGNLLKSVNGGGNFYDVTPSAGDWTTPFIQDPLEPNTYYGGWEDVYKSTDAGETWSPITSGQFSNSGYVIALAMTEADNNYIYAASLGGIFRSSDAGTTWFNIEAGLPTGSAGITFIAVSNTDPNKVWVTFSSYSNANKVFYSSNGGNTWTNYSGTLPNIPVNTIAYQKGSQDAVYVGTDFGIYYRDATMADWIPYNTDLPNVIVYELEINNSIQKIRACTYGRGIWESDLNTPSVYSLDAGVTTILQPASLLCANTFTPEVRIKNYGQTNINTITINYQIDSGNILTYTWNGVLAPGNTTDVVLPAVTTASGTHSILAFTTDPNGSADQNTFNDTRTKTFDVNSNVVTAPVVEGFENATFPPASWSVVDPNVPPMLVRITTASGFGNSTACTRARGRVIASAYASLLSSPIDFSTLAAPVSLSFSVAYAMYNSSSTDSLNVYVTTDCGATWIRKYSKTATALATAPIVPANFTPTASQWRTELIDLSAYAGQPAVQVRFEFYVDLGNNIHVDDINLIDANIGINDPEHPSVSVFPNPSAGMVHFNLPSDEAATIGIYSAIGSLVKEISVKENSVDVNINDLQTGIYVYRYSTANSKPVIGKLVKE
jgi:photosystem II stability/assembly factor-like uncharacterized protein